MEIFYIVAGLVALAMVLGAWMYNHKRRTELDEKKYALIDKGLDTAYELIVTFRQPQPLPLSSLSSRNIQPVGNLQLPSQSTTGGFTNDGENLQEDDLEENGNLQEGGNLQDELDGKIRQALERLRAAGKKATG